MIKNSLNLRKNRFKMLLLNINSQILKYKIPNSELDDYKENLFRHIIVKQKTIQRFKKKLLKAA